MWRVLVLVICACSQEVPDLTRLLSRSARSRQFDTLSVLVQDEYAQQTQQDQILPNVNFQEREVSIAKNNEKLRDVLFEGDMLLHPTFLDHIVSSAMMRRHPRQAFHDQAYPTTIWEHGVPYQLHHTLTATALASIERAITFWQKETCIDFYPQTSEAQFLLFVGHLDGCWSSVGKDDKFGGQVVSIGTGCSHFGVTSHELAHALGLFHEQSRYDRDASVLLNSRAVPRNLLYNFAKVYGDELTTYNMPYDIGSVMHYAPTEFAIDKRVPALTAVDSNLQFSMGNLAGPTFVDIALLNTHYKCARLCPNPPDCRNGGFVNARNCSECKCPSGFGGALCDEVGPSFSQSCGGVIPVGDDIRRFSITIRQKDDNVREKQCIYHFQAPEGRRIAMTILDVDGKCVEGCYVDRAEFKMLADTRPVGYRVCCTEQQATRFTSKTNVVPVIFFSTQNNFKIRFEYTQVSRKAFDAVEANEDGGEEVLQVTHDVTIE